MFKAGNDVVCRVPWIGAAVRGWNTTTGRDGVHAGRPGDGEVDSDLRYSRKIHTAWGLVGKVTCIF